MKKSILTALLALGLFTSISASMNVHAQVEDVPLLPIDSIIKNMRFNQTRAQMNLCYKTPSYKVEYGKLKFGGEFLEEQYNSTLTYGVIVTPHDDKASHDAIMKLQDENYSDDLAIFNDFKAKGYTIDNTKKVQEQYNKDNIHGDSKYNMAWVIPNIPDKDFIFDAAMYVKSDNEIGVAKLTTESYNSVVEKYLYDTKLADGPKKAITRLADNCGELFTIDKTKLKQKGTNNPLPGGKYLYAYTWDTNIAGHYTLVGDDGNVMLNPRSNNVLFVTSDNPHLMDVWKFGGEIIALTDDLKLLDFTAKISYKIDDDLINRQITSNSHGSYKKDEPLFIYFFGPANNEWLKVENNSVTISLAKRKKYTNYILVQTYNNLPQWNKDDGSFNEAWKSTDNYILEDKLGANIFFKFTAKDVEKALGWNYINDDNGFKVSLTSSKNPELTAERIIDKSTWSFDMQEVPGGFDRLLITGYNTKNPSQIYGTSDTLEIINNVIQWKAKIK